jgi:hypothetical protein
MTASSTSFTSQADGFRFPNRFEFSFRIDLPLVQSIDLGEVVYGLCGGMCYAALDCFKAGRPIPQQEDVPQTGTPLHLYLVDRQVDSLSLPAGLLKVLEWMMLDDGEVGWLTAAREFPKARRRLDRREPTVLAFIRQHGISDPSQNHQVVARAYDYDDRQKKLELCLYDPNHPGEEPQLVMDFSNPRGGIAAKQSTGESLRGFFVMDYRFQLPPF